MTALEASLTAEWLHRYDDAVAPVLPSYFDVVADRAQGSWVWDVDGKRYLDLGSGIAVTNTGHRHPHVVAAIHAQVDRLLHTSVVLKHQPYIQAAEAIAGLAPFLDDPRVFLCNSGAEAVDGAIKLARRTSGRSGTWKGSRSTASRRSATLPTSASCTAVQTTTNSSPPQRTACSVARSEPASRPATWRSTVSPTSWPALSLRPLKPSRSNNMKSVAGTSRDASARFTPTEPGEGALLEVGFARAELPPGGGLDWSIVALDGIGLLLFFIPGVIAFAVDFATGAIYLPPPGYGDAGRPVTDEQLVQVQVPPAELTPQRVEQVASQHVGRDVRLVAGRYVTAPLAKLADFWPTREKLASQRS